MLRALFKRLEVLAFTAALASAGCVHPDLPPSSASAPPRPVSLAARQVAPLDEVAFYDLTESHGLKVSIDLVTGRRVCRDGQNEVVVMPSHEQLVINGQAHALGSPIRWRNGVLYLPAESRALLAANLRLVPVPDVQNDPDLFDGREMSLALERGESAPRAVADRDDGGALPAAWRVEGGRPWRYIVIHHSATDAGGAKAFHREHAKKWQNGLGYHFVIGNGTHTTDGQIEVGTRWLRQADGVDGAHAGNKRYNQYGIGICLVGEFNQGRPSPQQLVALRRLCRALMARYRIPRGNIYPHRDVRKGHTDCPGNEFPFQAFVRSL